MTTIEADQALDLVRQVVEKAGPNYTYEAPKGLGCSYLQPISRKPSCLIGQALVKAGVPVGTLEWLDRNVGSIYNLPTRGGGDAALPGGTVLTQGALDVFSGAQTVQDKGDTWGDALEAAKRATWGSGNE